MATKYPKLKRDWIGRKVRLIRDVETKGGKIYPAGLIMHVYKNFNGLHVRVLRKCEHCGISEWDGIKGLAISDLELVDDEGEGANVL